MMSVSSNGVSSPMMFSGMRSGPNAADLAKMQEEAFAKMDANSDGGVDESELSAFLENASSTDSAGESLNINNLFSEMDADSDGAITQQESSDAINNMLKQLQDQMINSRMSGAGGMPPPPPTGPPPGEAPSDEEIFSSIDSDSDGNISQTELSAMLEQTSNNQGPSVDDIISRDDADSDGQISQEEFSTAMSQRQSEMESGVNPTRTTDRQSDAFIASVIKKYASFSFADQTLFSAAA